MSELRANTISDAAGTGPVTLTGQSAAKAWVNANGTGTVAIEQSLNISSMTDLGTGVYQFVFATNFSSARYSTVASCGASTASFDSFASLNPNPNSGNQTLWCLDRVNGAEDQDVVSFNSIGTLA